MTKYRVHVYATVRVPVEVEAESQVAALSQIEDNFCLREHLPMSGEVEGIDDAEEITGFVVDEIGDTNYINSRNYNGRGEPV